MHGRDAVRRELAESLDSRREERENLVNEVMEQLREKLEEAGLDAEVSGRAKHLYSIDRKMREAHIETDEIYDLMAVRIVVRSVDDCYQALAVVHARWRAVSGQFDDYISAPKSNNYQSLHTALSGPGGKPFEVQIRTEEMHREAELGVAATGKGAMVSPPPPPGGGKNRNPSGWGVANPKGMGAKSCKRLAATPPGEVALPLLSRR